MSSNSPSIPLPKQPGDYIYSPMRFPTTPASTPTTIIRNKDITLFDLHELMSITDRLGRAMMTPTPLWRPNPVNGVQGTLYDSVELKSVAKQLNQALRSAHRPEDLPYLHPRCLERLWRLGSVRKPRRIAGVHGADGGVKLPKPLVMKLWKKIKGAVLNRQQT